MAWLPEMCLKYPLSLLDDGRELSQAAKESLNHFHNFKYECPDCVHSQHPSIMCCSILPIVADCSIAKRLVTCMLAALRANGSFGVHVCINSTDHYMNQFYSKLGFVELYQDPVNLRVYLGRTF